MFRTPVKDRKENYSSKNSNHSHRNGKSYGAETEQTVLSTVRDLGFDAAQSMKRRAADLKDSAADYIAHGRRKARALRRSTKQRVKQNPKAALCIAAGIGLMMGMCISRRRK